MLYKHILNLDVCNYIHQFHNGLQHIKLLHINHSPSLLFWHLTQIFPEIIILRLQSYYNPEQKLSTKLFKLLHTWQQLLVLHQHKSDNIVFRKGEYCTRLKGKYCVKLHFHFYVYVYISCACPYHIKTGLKIWSVSIHAHAYLSSIWIATRSDSNGWRIHLLA